MTSSGDLVRLGRALGSLATRDRPLGALTTYRVGGPTALLAEPATHEELAAVARAVAGSEVPVLVVGRGSNLLVADGGFAGLAIRLTGRFEEIELAGVTVRAGGAAALPVVARRTAAAGLTGLEWAVGVPGSVGGAVRMNAGGHGSDTAATLVSYRWTDLATGACHEAPAAALGARYRSTTVATAHVVTEAVHALREGDPAGSAELIADIVRWRRAHQPGGANAGSVFANPHERPAGALIEEAGLKGFRIGTASVSTKHANFVQADEGGSAADVLAVIEHVRATVLRHAGVTLRTEVVLVGFSDDRATGRGAVP
ncbi:MAG: UDP-N-acetylmuramate dehydrogenase [Acidimicrobiales bacterium]